MSLSLYLSNIFLTKVGKDNLLSLPDLPDTLQHKIKQNKAKHLIQNFSKEEGAEIRKTFFLVSGNFEDLFSLVFLFVSLL